MATYQLKNKPDASILSDLQSGCSKVTGFSWVAAEAEIVTNDTMTNKDHAITRRYFDDGDHREWVTI